MEPASRAQRLAAVLVDCSLIAGASLIAGHEALPDALRVVGLAAGAAVLAANLYYLTVAGQSLGKRALSIRIVNKDTGENGGFTVNVLRRGVLPLLPYLPLTVLHPALGGFYIWADVLLIFRADRRCLHDSIAGTIVVQ